MNDNLSPSPDSNLSHNPASRDTNPDPITGEPGSHPIATGAGAAGAGLAGAAIGAVGGPVGAAIGAVIGAVAGGLGGHAAGEAIDPSAEDAHWRSSHAIQPYASANESYEDYQPAYRAGYEGFGTHGSQVSSFDEAEPALGERYQASNPKISWDKARSAARNAWNRVQESARNSTH